MIQVKYFGVIAEAAQRDSENIAENNMTLAQVLMELSTRHSLGDYHFQVAINRKIVSEDSDQVLSDGDEIAFLPPFSGG
ncbi:MoaD/ThiS family protein [Algoriphagus machipongonensis]|uniref:Molybdopterin synthase sulfur carrier subunit n=1 Tax=Algoriphagus machipongonensis TaxID=388413 RepID=A3HUR8_9BACT|nr:MoaD/ThiS family protein [Algoriphagus machipongonensis]EAZ81890.1 thiamineS [Algoriphagus machipongonensis]